MDSWLDFLNWRFENLQWVLQEYAIQAAIFVAALLLVLRRFGPEILAGTVSIFALIDTVATTFAMEANNCGVELGPAPRNLCVQFGAGGVYIQLGVELVVLWAYAYFLKRRPNIVKQVGFAVGIAVLLYTHVILGIGGWMSR